MTWDKFSPWGSPYNPSSFRYRGPAKKDQNAQMYVPPGAAKLTVTKLTEEELYQQVKDLPRRPTLKRRWWGDRTVPSDLVGEMEKRGIL